MSTQICPICKGRGIVPNDFYNIHPVSPASTAINSSVTCRSCNGKGYIIPYYNLWDYKLCNSCATCTYNDGVCYTTNPPKYRCTFDGEFHDCFYVCDKYDDTPVYGKIIIESKETTNNILNAESIDDNANDSENKVTSITKEQKTLGDVKVGEVIKIGDHRYIVLEHIEDTTAVITEEPVKSMSIGEDGNYAKSDVRKYCNTEFYRELCNSVGKHNIIPHTVNLVSDDGSNKGVTVKDNVSILTCDLYRRYRELLPVIGSPCWTATRVTTLDKGYARRVCIVNSLGILGWNVCIYSNGVRPFCILTSSIPIAD